MGGHRASGAGDELVDGPVDLAAVRADDALLDALAGGSSPRADQFGGGYGGLGAGGHDDDQIAAVLAAWRADIEADPMPELVTLDEAVEAVDAGHSARDHRSGRMRRRMPFAIAAAAFVVAFAGLSVAVHGAMPGDTLWSVSKAAFPSRASGIEKAQEAQVTIDAANAAIRRGDLATAKSLLQTIDKQVGALPPDVKPPLAEQQTRASQALTPGRGGSASTSTGSSSATGGTTSPGTGSGTAPEAPAAPAAPSAPDAATAPAAPEEPATDGNPQTPNPETGSSATTPPETTTTTPAPAAPTG